ncbi:MAG: hypothetical protein RI884_40 [Pseudomonadota bacterium]
MKKLFLPALMAVAVPMAMAKLPALDDAAKAKAAEAAAKTAWQGKVDAFQLCKSQDRVAAHYRKTGGAPAAKTAAAPAKPASGAAKPASAPQAAAPCVDPGPFVYTPAVVAAAPAASAAAPAKPASAPAPAKKG